MTVRNRRVAEGAIIVEEGERRVADGDIIVVEGERRVKKGGSWG